ncbi:putative protein serine/threonine kinase [Tieghemostelium lacteum]|uniref:ABC1 atypical kinase-like domain-containing protein n=1 Tax=Tieghemostelium lacteum TaxID=361077 RepID=A0A152A8V2_TIELA|nr:putative protein serine/threonine kinase [Tieghemostelium lacteum]|eukprot:KYR02649.1 putative protein serine/threonine kinase [Tieghemostelium lacteum]
MYLLKTNIRNSIKFGNSLKRITNSKYIQPNLCISSSLNILNFKHNLLNINNSNNSIYNKDFNSNFTKLDNSIYNGTKRYYSSSILNETKNSSDSGRANSGSANSHPNGKSLEVEDEEEEEEQSEEEYREGQKKKKKILFWTGLGILTVMGGTSLYFNEDFYKLIFDSAFVRNCRVLYTGFKVTLYYKVLLYGLERPDPVFYQKLKLANQLAAKDIVELCEKNKGVFIKIAQILASLDHILPVEYTSNLSVFQDHAPYEAYKEVQKLFQYEFGKDPDEIFEDFQRIPINSASLAQVHKAKLRQPDGTIREVAVKVQYPDLLQRFEKDLQSISNVMKYITWFFPQFQFAWLLPEATESLHQELDFINEGKNSEKMASLFKDNKQLKIPTVYWDQTTKRILTMEFIYGVRIDDKKGLEKLGINAKELYYLFSNLFATQIFVLGFLHSDPHPGNIFVRKMKDGRPEVVLLDHGLYKKIDNQVRLDFCHLWKAVTLGNTKEAEIYAKRLGAGEYAKHLGTLLNLHPEKSRENLRNLKKELGDQTLGAVTQILRNLPKEILLVLKTNNLIRQITTHFGIENGFLLMAKTCIKGIYTQNDIITKFKYYFNLFIFNITLKYIEFTKRGNTSPQL